MKKSIHRGILAVISLLILAALVYSSLMYTQYQAKQQVDRAIKQLESAHPQLFSYVKYQAVEATPWSLWTHHYELEGVQIRSNQPAYTVNIGRIILKRYTLVEQQLTQVSVSLENVRLQDDKGQLPAEISEILAHAQMNLAIDYEGNNKTLMIESNLLHDKKPVINYQLELSNYVLHPNSSADLVTQAITALNTAQIERSKSHGSLSFNTSDQSKNGAFLKSMAQQLGYNALSINCIFDGQYLAQTGIASAQLSIQVSPGGTLLLSIQEKISGAYTLQALVKAMAPELATPSHENSSPLLQLVSLETQYQDTGLFNRLITAIAHQTQQSPDQIKLIAITLLSTNPLLAQVPLLNQAAQQVMSFIQKPHTLSLSLHPTPPQTFEQMSQGFMKTVQSTELNDQQRQLPKNQRLLIEHELQEKRADQLNEFLKTLGFSVVAS